MTDGTMTTPVRIDYDNDVATNAQSREYRTGTPENNERLDDTAPTYLSDQAYSDALSAIVVACVDIMIIGPDGRVLLGERQQEPQPDWWLIGGRMRPRETYAQTAARNVRRELGIVIEAARLSSVPLDAYSNVWDTRQQEPQTDGCHTISTVMVYYASTEEIAALQPNKEYRQVAWVELDHVAGNHGYHPALRQMAIDLIDRQS